MLVQFKPHKLDLDSSTLSPATNYVFMLLSLADLIVWFMHKPVYSSGRRLLSGSHKEVVLAPVTKW